MQRILFAQHPRLQCGGNRIVSAARAIAMLITVALCGVGAPMAQPLTKFAGPTSSQPLALTADGSFLAVANPDSNSVSFFDLRSDKNRKLAEVPVQTEPNGVAFTPDGKKIYVANTASGTVSVIKASIANGVISKPTLHIPVGTEPYGLALTPNGTKLYVSNARSNSISVIDTASDTVTKTIPVNASSHEASPSRTMAMRTTLDETVYVTHFLSFPQIGKVDGQDDAKAGRVSVIVHGDGHGRQRRD